MEETAPRLAHPWVRALLAAGAIVAAAGSMSVDGGLVSNHFHPVPRLPVLLLCVLALAFAGYEMAAARRFGRWAIDVGISILLLAVTAVCGGALLFVTANAFFGKAHGEAALGALLLVAGLSLLSAPFVTAALLYLLQRKRGEARPFGSAVALVLEAGAVLAVVVLVGGSVSALTRSLEKRETLLAWAAREGRPDLTRFLLNRGANANAATRDGETPLLAAVVGCYPPPRETGRKLRVVEMLLAAGANPDGAGKNPADVVHGAGRGS